MNRENSLAQLKEPSRPFDLLVIGGGASGLGAAVEAAARGYRVALIDQGDFGQGTSSRSTNLVHGGVRYLKQGNVALVKSALRERERLRHNAPHLVHSLDFVIPTYAWWERSYYGFGMALYDLLAGAHSFGASGRLNRAEVIERLPTIETDGLTGGVLYRDGQFDDARLAVTLAQTADDLGAVVVNYCASVALLKQSGRVAGARVRDGESGEEFPVHARVVLNATGVFVDAVRRQDEPDAAPLVTVSQGSHIVLPREFLPGNSALMIPRTADGRVLFVIPWHERVIVGTTDTPNVTPTLAPRPLAEELDFILTHARRYLSRDPEEKDVRSIFAGLRPLVRRSTGGDTAALSRDHTIAASASGLITLTGGKWTTYRKMAEDVLDYAERAAGWMHRASRTADLRLHGANEDTEGPAHAKVYGRDATAIAALAVSEPEQAAPVQAGLPVTRAEVIWHAREEMARSVEDVLARRTRSVLLDARAAQAAAPMVARILARELHRSDAWVDAQVKSFEVAARNWLISTRASGQ